MTVYAGIRIVIECVPPVTGTNVWVAEIDNGPAVRAANGQHGARPVINASSLSALCTAIQSNAALTGVT